MVGPHLECKVGTHASCDQVQIRFIKLISGLGELPYEKRQNKKWGHTTLEMRKIRWDIAVFKDF